MMRVSTFCVSTQPTRMNSFSWRTRRSFACVSSEIVPISSKKIEPPSATSKRPFLLAIAPVKAPLTWPKRFDSSRSVGIEPEFTVTNGAPERGGVRVDRPRHELLARAALALDEDRGAGGPGQADELEDFPHASDLPTMRPRP